MEWRRACLAAECRAADGTLEGQGKQGAAPYAKRHQKGGFSMSWIGNRKVGQKLVGSFLLVVLLAWVVGAAGFLGLRSTRDRMVSIATSTPKLVDLLETQADVNAAVAESRASIMAFDRTGAQAALDAATRASTGARQAFSRYLQVPVGSGARPAERGRQVLEHLARGRPPDAEIQRWH
jgi:hypothetical protein